ncbi:sulfotransferase family protein [Roseibium sp.]|uniref:sulfotransferase family protein n=1 Tax=Roseibium sp. TaxID=1936156 RepID=UPI003BAD08F3
MKFTRKFKKSYAKRFVLGDHIRTSNFYDADCVAVFPEIKLCFNRIKKSGNTSTVGFLSDVCNYTRSPTTEQMKTQVTCVRTMTIKQLRATLGYHSLTVARDPYSRTLSAFLDKVARGAYSELACVPGYGDRTVSGFHQFLDFLLAGGTRYDRHFWPQTDLLFQPIERFDCVARLENLHNDLSAFLLKIGVHESRIQDMRTPHEMEQSERGKVTNAAQRMAKFYNEEARTKVAQIYHSDFAAFGY